MDNSISFLIASQQKQSHKAVVGTPWMNITLLSSPQTAPISMLSDHTRIPPQTINSSHMLLTRKLCWLIVMTLSNEKKEKPWGSTFLRSSMFWRSWLFKEHVKPVSRRKQHWNCWGRPTVLVFHLEGIAGQLQCASAILRQQPCKLNPCPTVCYVHVLTKEQGKGTCALPKQNCEGFWQLFGTGRLFGRPLFKQTLRNYQPCVSTPNNSWTIQRMCQSKKHCISQQLPKILSCNFGGTSNEQPWPRSCSVSFNMQWKASTLIQDLERDDIEGHLLEQLLKPIHALKTNLPLKCGKCWRVQSCRSCLTQTALVWVSVAPCRVQGEKAIWSWRIAPKTASKEEVQIALAS